ncbi:MAG: hypothetical protein IPL61_09870 [Myxococcales bacterium]|nr:hypothetical protein [Myxococcales bacterium]
MRTLVVLGALAAPTLALAAPTAELAADVDGDGAVDAVRIDAPGQLVIERGGGGGQLVPFGGSGALTEARLTLGALGARRVLVATARIAGRWEAVALVATRPGAALTELWRGPVGPGGDDEYEQWVVADARGLVRFQTRGDQRRCDGVPLELFPERWDERGRRFVAAPPARIDPPAGAPTVTAQPTGPGLATAWYRATTASRAAGAADASMLTAPRALGDGDLATAWTAGERDDGVGAVWNFRTTVSGGKAAAIRIVPSGDGAATRARPARLLVIAAAGAAVIEVPDPIARRAPPGQAYTAVLPTALDGCVSIALLDVHRGRGGAAIAELAVLADVELAPEGAGPVLAAQVVAGGLAAESAARLLIAHGAPAVVAIRAALEGATGDARRRLLAALAQIRDPGVIGPLAAALAAGDLPGARATTAAATLAALGPEGQGALLELIGGAGDEDAQRAAIAALATTDRAALIARAGRGPRAVRAELARALAMVPVATLVAAAQTAAEPAAAADLWRALGSAAATADPDARAVATTALAAALAAAGPSYELRYRTLAALAPLVDGAAVRTLAATVQRLPDSAAGHALARVAARGLANNRAPAAQLVLAELTDATDPGTRLEAVRGLANGGAGAPAPIAAPGVTGDVADAADRALINVLGADHWPAIRQQAAAGLGQRCGRPGPSAALIAAVDGDVHVPVRVEAVAALAQCPTAALDARFLGWIDDGDVPLPVRDRAIAAYGERPGVTGALLARFVRWRGQAFSDDTALQLAIRAATSLGQRGAAEAGPELLAAARDQAFPELAAAAIRALGALGPACPPAAPALLRGLLGADDQMLALAARAAITTCRAAPARP